MFFSQPPKLDPVIDQLFEKLYQNPEPSGHEVETTNICVQFFKDHINMATIHRFKNSHGFIAEMPGGSDNDSAIFFRVDLDAVPVNGISHACGHHGHMSIAAQLALQLQENPIPNAKVFLLFQPAEENAVGAASVLKDPVFEGVMKALEKKPYFFALHNVPGYENGQIVLSKTGVFSSAVISRKYKIIGSTSHAAYPELGHNPIEPISQLIVNLPAITEVLRKENIDSKISVVHATVGENWNGGTCPADGELCLTMRAHDNAKLESVLAKIDEKLKQYLGDNFKLKVDDFDYFPATENSSNLTESLIHIGGRLVIHKNFPFPWGEDFGWFLKKENYPGLMFGFGSGTQNTELHSQTYQFPKEIIPMGATIFYQLAKNLAPQPTLQANEGAKPR